MHYRKQRLKKELVFAPGKSFLHLIFFHHYIRINYCPLWNIEVEKAIKVLAKLVTKANPSTDFN